MNEAELLFTDILNTDRPNLILNRKRVLDKASAAKISAVLRRRIKGEPIQYILGKTEFMGLEFVVGPGVLIPRPETEILVEKTVEIARSSELGDRRIKILDIGTGSGCIAISLAKYLPGLEIYATDISAEALETARKNAGLKRVNVNFFLSDLFSAFPTTYNLQPTTQFTYDIIITNPPYIKSGEIAKLQPEIQHEPRVALEGGVDGLDFYRRIFREAHKYMRPQGRLLAEIGCGQASAIKNIIRKSKFFEIIEVIRDYNGIERVIITKRNQ